MGKVRRLRQKYHLARAKSMNDISSIAKEGRETQSDAKLALSMPGNPFEGIDIALNLGRTLLEDDVRSIVTTKSSLRDRNLSKLEKRVMRHQTFMRKLDLLQQLKKEATDRKKRQRTAITGDMRPLADALPPLEVPGAQAAGVGTRPCAGQRKSLAKARQRQKEMLNDITAFRKVLSDPAYKTDPTGAISNYIQEKIQMELMEEES